VRPTILSLVGLQDTYIHDGRVLTETIDDHAVPKRLRDLKHTLPEFAHIYKQINAPFGRLALASLKISTAALASDTADDSAYTALENKIATITARRDAIAAKMKTMLDGAAFKHESFDEITARQLINHAEALLEEVSRCAANVAHCAK
jgi:cell division protein FtsB